jgi:hypothetical protein
MICPQSVKVEASNLLSVNADFAPSPSQTAFNKTVYWSLQANLHRKLAGKPALLRTLESFEDASAISFQEPSLSQDLDVFEVLSGAFQHYLKHSILVFEQYFKFGARLNGRAYTACACEQCVRQREVVSGGIAKVLVASLVKAGLQPFEALPDADVVVPIAVTIGQSRTALVPVVVDFSTPEWNAATVGSQMKTLAERLQLRHRNWDCIPIVLSPSGKVHLPGAKRLTSITGNNDWLKKARLLLMELYQ